MIHILHVPTVTIVVTAAATCSASKLVVCTSMSIARARATERFELELHTGQLNDGQKPAGPENFG